MPERHRQALETTPTIRCSSLGVRQYCMLLSSRTLGCFFRRFAPGLLQKICGDDRREFCRGGGRRCLHVFAVCVGRSVSQACLLGPWCVHGTFKVSPPPSISFVHHRLPLRAAPSCCTRECMGRSSLIAFCSMAWLVWVYKGLFLRYSMHHSEALV